MKIKCSEIVSQKPLIANSTYFGAYIIKLKMYLSHKWHPKSLTAVKQALMHIFVANIGPSVESTDEQKCQAKSFQK